MDRSGCAKGSRSRRVGKEGSCLFSLGYVCDWTAHWKAEAGSAPTPPIGSSLYHPLILRYDHLIKRVPQRGHLRGVHDSHSRSPADWDVQFELRSECVACSHSDSAAVCGECQSGVGQRCRAGNLHRMQRHHRFHSPVFVTGVHTLFRVLVHRHGQAASFDQESQPRFPTGERQGPPGEAAQAAHVILRRTRQGSWNLRFQV